MIIGNLQNLKLSGLADNLQKIMTSVAPSLADFNQLDDGRIESEDGSWFCNVGNSITENVSVRQTEWHKQYADIQLVLAGEELINCSCKDASGIASFEKKPDLFILDAPELEHSVHLQAGDFALFLPGEPHQALCEVGSSNVVRKAVFKIPLALLGG